MTDIQIAKGQGLSQAIATKLGLSKDELKDIKLETWQSVMTLIKDEQAQGTSNDGSIFTGGSDTSTINQSSNWKSNFIVQEGTVNISDENWSKIEKLFGKEHQNQTTTHEPVTEPDPEPEPKVTPEETQPKLQDMPDNAKIKRRDIMNVGEAGSRETVAKVKDADGNEVYYQVETDPETHQEKLGQRLIADPRGLKKNQYYAIDDTVPQTARADLKTVDGEKDKVIISYKDDNKVKHYYATVQNEDGTIGQGEELYPIAGSNKFYSQTKVNQYIKDVFHVDKLPEGITVQLIQSYGDVQYIFKKDGQSIDIRDVAKIVKAEQAQNTETDTNPPTQTTPVTTPTQPTPKMSDEDVQKFMAADPSVKAAMDQLPTLKANAESLTQSNNDAWQSHDISAIRANGGLEAFLANSNYQNTDRAIKQYQQAMQNWQDGTKLQLLTGEWSGQEFERVTLDNGAKGFKVDRTEGGKTVTYYFNVQFDTSTGFAGNIGSLYKRVET
ncbi:hypothetical protein IJ707_08070 [bacterium]|nr:hypothetical protein [bacterium]